MNITKRFKLFFSVFALITCMLFASGSVFADEISPEDYAEYYQEEETTAFTMNKENAEQLFGYLIENQLAQYLNCTHEELMYISEASNDSFGMYEGLATALGEKGLGSYKAYKYDSFSTGEDGTYSISGIINFEKGDIKLTIELKNFDTIGPQLTGCEYEALEAEGEGPDMMAATANTLMGMGTVFLVLIFISLIISLFGFIPNILNKSKKKKETVDVVKTETLVATTEVVEETDNLELVAVIAAAIAASENTSTDSFVVRSIRRRF